MKFVIASDIHGSAYWAERLMRVIDDERPDSVLLWGTCSTTGRVTTCRAITPPSA